MENVTPVAQKFHAIMEEKTVHLMNNLDGQRWLPLWAENKFINIIINKCFNHVFMQSNSYITLFREEFKYVVGEQGGATA